MGRAAHAVHAYAIYNNVRPRELLDAFGPRGTALKTTKSQVIVHFGGDEWAVVYDFGVFVFIAMAETERDAIVARLLARVGPEPHPPLREGFTLEVDSEGPPRVAFDRVTVPVLNLPVVDLVSHVVAQSVGMEYYEDEVELNLRRLDRLADMLAEKGRIRGRIRDLLRIVGQGMSTRNQVLSTLSLLDAPPLAWESETLDRVYRALRASFEIEDRYRSLDHKLRMIQDNLELLVDLAQHRRAFLLEVAVIVLIGIEVVLFVYQLIATSSGH